MSHERRRLLMMTSLGSEKCSWCLQMSLACCQFVLYFLVIYLIKFLFVFICFCCWYFSVQVVMINSRLSATCNEKQNDVFKNSYTKFLNILFRFCRGIIKSNFLKFLRIIQRFLQILWGFIRFLCDIYGIHFIFLAFKRYLMDFFI